MQEDLGTSKSDSISGLLAKDHQPQLVMQTIGMPQAHTALGPQQTSQTQGLEEDDFSFGQMMLQKSDGDGGEKFKNDLTNDAEGQEVQEIENLMEDSLKASRDFLIPREPNSYRKQREAEEMNETDVYPIRISLNPRQILRMKFIRIIAFICCFFFIVPFDLYIKDQHFRRIWLYDTDYYFHTVIYDSYTDSQNITNAFDFDLTNCKIYLMESSSFAPQNQTVKFTKQMAFEVEFGFTWGTPFTFNDTNLEIIAAEDQQCIVNVWASSNAIMPKFKFSLSGEQDNMMFRDNTPDGVSLDFVNGIRISGSKVFVTLSDHKISNLTIVLLYGIVLLDKIVAPIKFINITEGIYKDLIPDSVAGTTVRMIQPEGNICIASRYTVPINKGRCDPVEKNILSSLLTGNYSCVIDAEICLNKAKCSNLKNTATIIVDDGQIQMSYAQNEQNSYAYDTIARQVKGYDAINFTFAAFSKMNDSVQAYKLNEDLSRITRLQVIGTNYQQTWMYTNKKVYFQANYWTLIWASAGLLTPTIDSLKVLMIDSQCPNRDRTISLDAEISDYIKNLYPIYPQSDIAFADGLVDTIRVVLNSFGEYEYIVIQMQENPLLLAAFGLSALIALLGGLFSVFTAYKFYKYLKRRFNQYVQERKNLSITLKIVKAVEKKILNVDEEILDQINLVGGTYESRGIFTSRLVQKVRDIKKYNLAFSFSLYQIPAMLLDHFFRKQTNSIIEFLGEVPEDKYSFTFSRKRMRGYDKTSVSMPLYEFQQIYSRFCNINGFNEQSELDSETNSQILKAFGISFLSFEDTLEPAYANLRLKTLKEMAESRLEQEVLEKMTSSQRFLNENCIATKFRTDVISFQELKYLYDNFCKINDIPYSKKVQIIGSEDMTNFGAVVVDINPPKRLLGIKRVKVADPEAIGEVAMLIRQTATLRSSIMTYLLRTDGLIPNVLIAIIHFFLILIVPLISPFIAFNAIILIPTFQGDVFAKQMTMMDFFSVNRMNPWWENIPNVQIVLYIHAYVVVYLFFAYLEIFSYYLTGFYNNGKYVIMYSFARRFIMINFYIGISFFLFLYTMMIIFTIQWGILGAIFNPTALLPYSAAIVTFIATVGAKFNYFKQKYENLSAEIEIIVKEKIGYLIIKSLEKIKASLGQKYASLFPEINEQAAQEAIEKGMNQVLELETDNLFDLEGATDKAADLAKTALMNNASALANLISGKVKGLDPSIIELIIAVAVKNDNGIKESLDKLATILGIEPSLLHSFIALAAVNVRAIDEGNDLKKPNLSQVVQAVKQIFRHLHIVDESVSQILGNVCSILIEGDTEPIMDILVEYMSVNQNLEKVGMNSQDLNMTIQDLLGLLLSAVNKTDSQVFRKNALKMIRSSYESDDDQLDHRRRMSVENTIELLERLKLGDFKPFIDKHCYCGIDKQKGIIGFKTAFPVLVLIDTLLPTIGSSNSIIIVGIKEIIQDLHLKNAQFGDHELMINNYNTNSQYFSQPERALLGLNYITRGQQIDLVAVADLVNRLKINLIYPDLDADFMQSVVMLNGYSKESFSIVVRKMGLAESKNVLLDLYDLMLSKNSPFTHLLEKLELMNIFRKNFFQLVQIFKSFLEYQMLCDEYRRSNSKIAVCQRKLKEIQIGILHKKQKIFIKRHPFYDTEIKDLNQSIENTQARLAEMKSKDIWVIRKNIGKFLYKISCLEPKDYEMWMKKFKSGHGRVYNRAVDQYKSELRLARNNGKLDVLVIEKKPKTAPKKLNSVDIESNSLLVNEPPSNEVGNDALNLSMNTEENEATATPEMIAKCNPAKRSLKKCVNLFINFQLDSEEPGNYYLNENFYNKILQKLCIKQHCKDFEASSDLNVLYNLSTLMLRIQGTLPREVDAFYEGIENIAVKIGIDEHLLEMILDFIIGDPRKVFRLKRNQDIAYDLDKIEQCSEFSKTLETARLKSLQKLFKGSDQALGHVFLHWYHQYKISNVQKETVEELFIPKFGIKKDFIQMLQAQIDIERERVDEFDGVEILKKKINTFIANNFMLLALGETSKFAVTGLAQPIADARYKSDFENPFQFNLSKTMLMIRVHQFFNSLNADILSQILEDESTQIHELLRNYYEMGMKKRMTNVLKLLQDSAEHLTSSYSNRQEFIGTQLLLNATQLSRIYNRNPNQNNEFVDQFQKLFDGEKYNSLSLGQPSLTFEDGDEKNMYQCMYDNTFLDPAIKFLMKPVIDHISYRYPNNSKKSIFGAFTGELHPVVKQVANNLMGVFLGHSIDDKQIMRSSIIELVVNKQMVPDHLEGFIAILLDDISCNNQIESFCSKIGISGSMLINMIKLLDKSAKDLYTNILQIIKEACSSDVAQNIASLLSLTHFDENQIKPILTKIKVKNEFAIPTLMAVISSGDDLAEHMSSIRQALKLKSLAPLKEFMGLIKGKPTAMLSKLSTQGFEVKFIRSFFQVMRNGFEFSNQLTDGKIIRGIIYKINDDIDYLSKRMYQYFTLDTKQKNKMALNTGLLIKACWGDQKSLRILVETMKGSASKESLWMLFKSQNVLKDSSREAKFLKHCLWRLFEYNRDTQMTMLRSKKQTIRILMETILPYIIKKRDQGGEQKKTNIKDTAKDDSLMSQAVTALLDRFIANDIITKKPDAKIIDLQKAIKTNGTAEVLATKVGCTFRFTQMTKIHQPMFRCRQCNVNVCLVCATLYHKAFAVGENVNQVEENKKGEETKNLEPLKNSNERHFCSAGKMNLQCKPPTTQQPKGDVILPEEYIRYKQTPQSDKVGFQDTVYHERLQTYTIPDFINDLSRGLGIERYTVRDISQAGFSNLYEVLNHEQQKDNELLVLGSQVEIQKLNEPKFEAGYTLLENIVLMSFGRITSSMTNHLLQLEEDGVTVSQNFYAYEKFGDHTEDVAKLYQYKVLRTLSGICAQDIEIFDQHSVDALKQAGVSVTDIQKYSDLLLLANGGELDMTRESMDSIKGTLKTMYVNPYMNLFQMLFKNDWKAMISLHKFLLLSPKDLQAVFTESPSETEIVTLYEENDWVYDGLFKDYMGMNGKSANIMQGLVALMSRDRINAAGLWKLIKIPDSKATKYMDLVLQEDLYNLIQIGNLVLPETLSTLLVNGLAKLNTANLADFGAKYLNRLFQFNYFNPPDSSKSKLQIEWLQMFDERIQIEVENKKLADPNVFMAHHTFYLKKVIELMSTDFDSNHLVNLQYIYSVAHGCQNLNDKINLVTPATQLYKFQTEERGQLTINPKETIAINSKDMKKFSQLQNNFLISTISFEAIQGLELCSQQFLTLLYVDNFKSIFVTQKQVQEKQSVLLSRIRQIKELLTAPEIDIQPSNILKMLKERQVKEKFFGGLRKADYEMPSDLEKTEIDMITLIITAINQADIVIASRVVDLMTNVYSKNYLKSAISKLAITAIEQKSDSTSDFFNNAIKCTFARIFEQGMRNEFSNLPQQELDDAIKQAIEDMNIPLIIGCCTTDNKDVMNLFKDNIFIELERSAMNDAESGQKFDTQAFDRLIQPDSDDNHIASYMSFVCRNDFHNIGDDSKKGIIKLIINNAGKLPMAREIFQKVQGAIVKFALPKELTDMISTVAKTAGLNNIPTLEQEINEFSNQILSNVLKAIKFEQVMEIMVNPGSQASGDFSAKLDTMLDLEKLPNLRILFEKEYNIEREVRKYMESFFKQISKNLNPFYVEVQAYFVNQLYQCFNGQEISLRNLTELMSDYLDAVLDFDPDLQKAVKFISFLIQKDPLLAIDNIDGFLNLAFKVISGVDDNLGGAGDAVKALEEAQKKFETTVKPLILLIKQWMKVVSLAVGQESQGASKTDFRGTLLKSLTDSLDSTQAYLIEQKILTPDHPLQQVFSKMNLIKAVLIAIISLSQGNYEGIESLAVILGGVPAKEGFQRLKQAIQVIQANKDGITFNSVKAIAASNMDLAFNAIPIKIPGIDIIEELIAKGIDNPASLVEPKTFFDLFKNQKGVIGLDEFKNIFNQLGINMPHATILQVFAVADIEKKGELTYPEFAKALSGIKEQLVQKFVVELGFSVQEMVITIVFTAFMLILQFVFIFIGMAAFSPTTAFSSVINSLMALGASFAAKGNDSNQDKSAKDVKETLDVTTA